LELIRNIGEKALTYYGRGKLDVKFDEELVTEAELSLMKFFQDQLHIHFPDHQVFNSNQKNEGYTHEGKRYLWIFDALEGVANFQAGIPIWGSSLSLLENFPVSPSLPRHFSW
jgi:myo-inositol-1(or 4)-monophosphatase